MKQPLEFTFDNVMSAAALTAQLPEPGALLKSPLATRKSLKSMKSK
jgi:hypothetical protein